MTLWILLALILGALLLAALLAVLRRSRARRPAPPPPPDIPEDPAAQQERRRVADERGSELIQRRVQLDARRGALGGDSALDDAFDRLEQRLRSGEISEEEFEAEKIRLLGG